MRRFWKRVCCCFMGRPITPSARLHNKKEEFNEFDFISYEREEMAEHAIDTSEWTAKEIKNLSPYKIKDSDLTKEYTIKEESNTGKLKELGYELGDIIGKGAYGKVHIIYKYDKSTQTTDRNSGNELACKIMALSRLTFGPKDKQRMANFKNELFTLVKSKHKNIIAIKDHFIINNSCYLIMEYANGGNLNTFIKTKGKPLEEIEAMHYFAQMSSGIYYLHCCLGFAHLDIKLGNTLVFGSNKTHFQRRVIKITDFGLSRLRIDPKKGVLKEISPRGTTPYMSPQVLLLYILDRLDEESLFGRVKPFNPFIADIWSLGVCLFLMLCREFPFDVPNDPRLMRSSYENQKRKKFKYPSEVRYKLSTECKDMIEDCLEPNPHKRLTIQNIVSHIWFDKHFTIEELINPK